jgi:hypothetical protein
MTMKHLFLLACCGGLLATACGNLNPRLPGGRAVPDAALDAVRDVGHDAGPDTALDAGFAVDVAPGRAVDAGGGGRSTGWADDRVLALVAQMTYAEKIAQLQNTAPAIPRLGLAAYQYWNEGLHGVRTDGATSFPQAIALASTWDPDLLLRVASAISDEARGFNVKSGYGLTYWSPVINMLRDPRWGRFEESYSEDPYLMARMGVAFVKGLQGDDPKYLKAVATPKHFAGNNSEYNRHNGSSDIDEQLLHEYYLPAFEATVVEAGAFLCHVCLQQRERGSLGGEPATSARHPSRCLGFQGLRGLGLRCRVGHRQQPPLDLDHHRGGGQGVARRHGSQLRADLPE